MFLISAVKLASNESMCFQAFESGTHSTLLPSLFWLACHLLSSASRLHRYMRFRREINEKWPRILEGIGLDSDLYIGALHFGHDFASYSSFLTLLEKLDQIHKQSTDFCSLVHYNDRFNWFCNFCKNQQIHIHFFVDLYSTMTEPTNFLFFWNLFGIFQNFLESYRICK